MHETEFKPPTMTLEATAFTKKQILLELDAPQVALAGRSNVGKSSLVNCLAGRRKGLAKISATPGKTRSLNYYRVGQGELYLVDLPGYGYAKYSKQERDHWAKLVEHYFTVARQRIVAVAVLLDCRHPPQRLDQELTAYLSRLGMRILPVLTKADKCNQSERTLRIRDWSALIPDAEPLLFSSKTGQGRDELWQRMLQAAG